MCNRLLAENVMNEFDHKVTPSRETQEHCNIWRIYTSSYTLTENNISVKQILQVSNISLNKHHDIPLYMNIFLIQLLIIIVWLLL